MFYEVKVFNAKGELKKVLSPKKLSNRFWKKGEQNLIDFAELGSALYKSLFINDKPNSEKNFAKELDKLSEADKKKALEKSKVASQVLKSYKTSI